MGKISLCCWPLDAPTKRLQCYSCHLSGGPCLHITHCLYGTQECNKSVVETTALELLLHANHFFLRYLLEPHLKREHPLDDAVLSCSADSRPWLDRKLNLVTDSSGCLVARCLGSGRYPLLKAQEQAKSYCCTKSGLCSKALSFWDVIHRWGPTNESNVSISLGYFMYHRICGHMWLKWHSSFCPQGPPLPVVLPLCLAGSWTWSFRLTDDDCSFSVNEHRLKMSRNKIFKCFGIL